MEFIEKYLKIEEKKKCYKFLLAYADRYRSWKYFSYNILNYRYYVTSYLNLTNGKCTFLFV